jgi:hypothetical protein
MITYTLYNLCVWNSIIKCLHVRFLNLGLPLFNVQLQWSRVDNVKLLQFKIFLILNFNCLVPKVTLSWGFIVLYEPVSCVITTTSCPLVWLCHVLKNMSEEYSDITSCCHTVDANSYLHSSHRFSFSISCHFFSSLLMSYSIWLNHLALSSHWFFMYFLPQNFGLRHRHSVFLIQSERPNCMQHKNKEMNIFSMASTSYIYWR